MVHIFFFSDFERTDEDMIKIAGLNTDTTLLEDYHSPMSAETLASFLGKNILKIKTKTHSRMNVKHCTLRVECFILALSIDWLKRKNYSTYVSENLASQAGQSYESRTRSDCRTRLGLSIWASPLIKQVSWQPSIKRKKIDLAEEKLTDDGQIAIFSKS